MKDYQSNIILIMGKIYLVKNKYYDFYITFMRAINTLKKDFSESSSQYIEVCKQVARCLSMLGNKEMLPIIIQKPSVEIWIQK